MENGLVEYLKEKFKMGDTITNTERRFVSKHGNVIFDLTLEDNDKIILVELKKIATAESIAQFYIAKEKLLGSTPLNKKAEFVMISRSIGEFSQEIAMKLGIICMTYSLNSYEEINSQKAHRSAVKITAPKAWKVINTLLSYQPISILGIKKKSHVSYGEAHWVIQSLNTRNMIQKNGYFVSVNDVKRLLNLVSWERPTSLLFKGEYNIPHDNANASVEYLSKSLHDAGINHSFTGLIAYLKYYGDISKVNTYDVYIDLRNADTTRELDEISDNGTSGVKLKVYQPDREIFLEAKSIGGVTLVSPEQLLLDLSGGDAISYQYAMQMVNKIGKI